MKDKKPKIQNTKKFSICPKEDDDESTTVFSSPYGTTQNQELVLLSHKNSHSADVHMYTCNKTHTTTGVHF